MGITSCACRMIPDRVPTHARGPGDGLMVRRISGQAGMPQDSSRNCRFHPGIILERSNSIRYP